MSKDISLKELAPMLKSISVKVRPYIGVAFFVLLAIIYSFVILQINKLSNQPLDESQVSEQSKAAPTPRIDAQAAKQLQTLKDNSVNVQALFEESRQSPFQE
jgi:hypothetical protein